METKIRSSGGEISAAKTKLEDPWIAPTFPSFRSNRKLVDDRTRKSGNASLRRWEELESKRVMIGSKSLEQR